MRLPMKKKWHRLGIILLFIVGMSILLYPTISDKWNRRRADALITTYEGTVGNISKTDYSNYLEAARAYNEKLIGSKVPDAFSVRDGIKDPEYEKILDVTGDGIMGYVKIPSIDVTLPIYHYTTEETLKKGAGHLTGSSVPVGGENTHAVISAHRGLPSAKLFTDLNLLENGDVFYLHVLGETLAYQVDQIQTVEPSNTEALGIVPGKDYVTLVTCTPYGVNTQRLLVRGTRIAYNSENGEDTLSDGAGEKHNQSKLSFLVCVAIGLAAGLLISYILLHIKEKLKKSEGKR